METRLISDRRMSFQDYLDLADKSQEKLEYHDGLVVAMAGASPAHNRIVTDLSAFLVTSAKTCRGFNSDQAVVISEQNRYVFPDISFVCDEEDQFDHDRFLISPALLIEVLSDKTEKHDRGPKFSCTAL